MSCETLTIWLYCIIERCCTTGGLHATSSLHACRPQLYIYSKCIRDHGSRHRWMAFIDADEFFVIKDGTPSLPALLRDYEDFGGLAVNWQVGFASES